ncbi:MAG: LuxR family transcriptional regulator [bacterium F082]|nr:MAG: LuxR family transcriptional regulator [bacterium F082]KWW31872.1 MAG: LuxR family transcriptional regulator [bacterium P201]
MKKYFLLLFLVLFALSAFAQEDSSPLSLPDSLVGRLKEFRKTDLNRAEALEAAIRFYFDERRILEAETYINELAALSDEIKDRYWKAVSLYYKSLCAYESNLFSENLPLINKSLQITETLRETTRTQLLLTRICLAKSAFYFRNNQFPECQSYIDRGLELAENNGFEKLQSSFHNNYGALLMRMERFEDAIVQFKMILADDKNAILNIASSFQQLKQYDSAFYYLDSIIRYMPKAGVKDRVVQDILIKTYQTKAVCYLDLEQWDDALQCLKESRVLLEKFDDKKQFCVNYLHDADANNGKGLYETALCLIDTAIIISRNFEDIYSEWFAVKLKSDILENMKDYEREVENLRYFNILTDTINNRENLLKVQEQQYQHEATQMEKQYELQQQAFQQKQLIIIILAVFITIIATLVAILILLNKKRLASELALRNREITAKSMDKIQSNEMLNNAIEKLTEMEEHPENNVLPGVIRDLKTLIDADTKKDFDLHFVQMHPDFYQKLLTDFPNLTPNELRLCAFIKSNLSIKEIATINGISVDSVKTARKRLRKSLNLTGEDVSLLGFLSKY